MTSSSEAEEYTDMLPSAEELSSEIRRAAVELSAERSSELSSSGDLNARRGEDPNEQ